MKKVFSIILSAVVFGGSGFTAGYLVSKRKYISLADKEVESILAQRKEHDAYLLKLHGVNPNEAVKSPKEDIKTTEKIIPVKPNMKREPVNKPEEVTEYHKIADSYKAPKSGGSNQKDSKIYVVDDEEFSESTYESSTLYYYSDGIVTDEDDNVISDFYDYIGPITLWSKYFADGVDAVYIRNETRERDYEVIRQNGKWKSTGSDNQKESLLDLDDENESDDY